MRRFAAWFAVMPANVRIDTISPRRADVKSMIGKADELMKALYPPQSNHLDDVAVLEQDNVCFVGAFVGDQLGGIGAVKMLDDDGVYGEIKRVFVAPRYRGQNIAGQIMHYLETRLLDKAIFIARLETGAKQAAAIRLYQKLGYQVCRPFGQYSDDPLSVFMQKTLGPG